MPASGASSYLARVAAAGARRVSGVDMPAIPPPAVPPPREGRDHLPAVDEPLPEAPPGPAERPPPVEGAAAAAASAAVAPSAAAPGPVSGARVPPWPSPPTAGPGAGRASEEAVTVVRAPRALRSQVPSDPPASTLEPPVTTRPAETAPSPSPGPLPAPEPTVHAALTASRPAASGPEGGRAPEPPLRGDAGAVPPDAPPAAPPAVARVARVAGAPRAPAPGSWARSPDVAVHVEPAPAQGQARAGARPEAGAKLSIGRIDLLVDNRPPERPAATAAPAAPAARPLDPMTDRFLDRLLLHPR